MALTDPLPQAANYGEVFTRRWVVDVLRPLIRPLITDDEYREACAAAARSLCTIWVTQEPAADAG